MNNNPLHSRIFSLTTLKHLGGFLFLLVLCLMTGFLFVCDKDSTLGFIISIILMMLPFYLLTLGRI